MKVGIYLGDQEPTIGGGFSFSDRLARGLRDHDLGVPYTIFTRSARSSDPDRIVATRSPENRLRKARHLLARGFGQARGHYLNRILADSGIDFLWLASPAYFEELSVPYAVTVWDLAHRQVPFFPEVAAGDWTQRESVYAHMLPRAAIVVVGTSEGRDQVCTHYGVAPSRVAIIPLPATPVRSPREQPVEPAQPPYLIYPAQFWAHKNHVNALHALKLVRERDGIDLELRLTGADQGNLAHVIRVTANLGLEGAVHVHGFVSNEELSDLYAGALALLFPSFFGPDNLPPLEAFAHRCPVIASDIPGHAEQLGDAALLFDPTSPEAIADRIVEVYRSEELRRSLVERGLALVADRGIDTYVALMRDNLRTFERIRRTWPSVK